MAKCGITNISGGGGIGSDELSVTADKVVEGNTYVGADTNDEIGAGTLVDRASTTGAMSVARGGADNNYIYTRIPKGAYRTATGVGYPEVTALQSDVATAGGLSADKIMAGKSAFGMNGTATSDANVVASDILVNKSAYGKGAKIAGSMPDYRATTTAIDAIRINNNRFEVAVAAGCHGYSWANNGYEYMTYDQVANAIGLTAAKLKKGEVVCGKTGTFEGWVPTATDYYLRGNNIKGITINAGQQVTFESGGIRTENTSGSTQPYKKPELRFPSVNLTPYNYLNVTLRYESKKWSYNGERNLCMEANVRKVGSYTSDSLGKAFSSGLPVNTEFTISVPISTLAYTAEIILDLGITFEYYYTGDSGNKWETLDKYAWTGWIYRLWFS